MEDQVVNLFNNLVGVARTIGLSAAGLFLAWAGFLYMTAGGSPRRMESAKDAAFAAVGGLAIVLLASTIATLVQNAIPRSS
ncbi:MAG TPA: pilin [Chloroflexota bacterium]|nr:pilin [Chloroflexota bacterium]